MKTIPSAALTLLALALAAPPASATERIDVRDGASVPIQVSARELTRITMTAGDRLERVFGVSGVMDVQPDKSTGDVFIRPTITRPGRAFSFFVRDARGATYTLLAKVVDIPSQTVVLHPVGPSPQPIKAAAAGRSTGRTRRIEALMRTMATGHGHAWSRTDVGALVPIWRQTDTVLDARWQGDGRLEGQTWTVRNRTAAPIRLDERDFLTLYPDVTAVAIEHLSLAPQEATRVFLVLNNERRNRP
jgi:TraK protein.